MTTSHDQAPAGLLAVSDADQQPLAGRVSVSADEAASCTGLSVRTVRRLIDTGELRSIKIGRRRLIPVDALLELFERGAA